MSVEVRNVVVHDNPTKFTNPFQFEIEFDCHPPGITEELEWKLVYVGSADDEKYDQVLDTVLVGPVSVGRNKFLFQAPPPDHTQIPEKDLLEVTVILLTGSYRGKEFIRIGYYVNNDDGQTPTPAAAAAATATPGSLGAASTPAPSTECEEDEAPTAATGTAAPAVPPRKVDFAKLMRNIMSDKPVVTRFPIPWDTPEPVGPVSMMTEAEAAQLEQRLNQLTEATPAEDSEEQDDGDEEMEDDEMVEMEMGS